MDDCGILVIGRVAVVELPGERIREGTPLVAAKLGLTLDGTLLDIRLLLVGGIEDVEPVGLGGSTQRMHDLVGLDIVLGGVNHDSQLKTVGGDPLRDLKVGDGRGVAVGEVGLGTLGDVGGGVDAVDGHPSAHLLLRLAAEQLGTAFSGPHDELTLAEVNLTGADGVEGVLNKTHGELAVVLLVTEGHLLTEAHTLTVGETGKTEVGVLSVLHLGGDTTVKGVVLVLGPGLLDLPSDVVDPTVNSGVDELAVNLLGDGDMAAQALAELTSTDLVLETDPLPIAAHGDRGGEPHVTNFAGEVVLDRGVSPAETLTGEKTLDRDTTGEMSAEALHLIDGVDTLGLASLGDDNRISLVVVAPENLTESEPVGRENKIEGLETDADVIGIGGLDRSPVATPRLNERDIAP